MKEYRRLLSSIHNQAFFLGPEGVAMSMPVFLAFRNGLENPRMMYDSEAAPAKAGYESRFVQASTPYVSKEDQYWLDYYPVLTDAGVLVIPVMESIMQYDYCGVPGTSTIAKWYQQGEADPAVKAFVEITNSPGGSVLGTAELAATKLACTKTIVTFNEGMCCSGGQYIAAASDYTFASSLNNMFGSIGVMISYRDYTKYYEEKGIKVVDLYSIDSPLKNAEHRAALEGDYTQYTEGILYKFDQNFMSFVKGTRSNVSELALKGKTMLTEEALGNGLIDGIATFDQAIQFALSNPPRTTTPKIDTSMFDKIRQKFGLTTEQPDAAVAETEVIQQIENLNTQVSERDTTIAGHVATIAERDTTITQLNEQIQTNQTSHQTEVANLNATIADLQSRVPGAVAEQAVATTTDTNTAENTSEVTNSATGQAFNFAEAAAKAKADRQAKNRRK